MAKRDIELDVANALTYLGQLYKNPRDALKEYVSNAIDAWSAAGAQLEHACRVHIKLSRDSITVESFGYPGMSEKDFRHAMGSVARSLKLKSKDRQIGRLGIGLFAFSQFAHRALIYSRPSTEDDTFRFQLERGGKKYETSKAANQQTLPEPGVTVHITGLTERPMARRGPLQPRLLKRYLSEQFASHLRTGKLALSVAYDGQTAILEAPPITLEPVAEGLKALYIDGNIDLHIQSELYFQPSGEGAVGIRHSGLYIVRDMSSLDPLWVGFDDSALCSGYVEGAFDADFLEPLPARTGFEPSENWHRLISWLQRVESTIGFEVEDKRDELEIHKLDQIQTEAIKIAEEAFSTDQLSDLELLSGLRRRTTLETPRKKRQRREPKKELESSETQ